MKKTVAAAGLCFLVLGLALFITRCSPDWYAEIPCQADSECPQDFHCEQQKCTEGEAAGEPGFEVGVKAVDFGEVQVGESVTKEVSVKNSGKAGTKFEVTPTFSKDYKAVGADPKAQVSVPPGKSVSFKLTYRPTDAEPIPELYLVLTSSETGKPMRKISITGSAIAPRLTYEPADGITFPAVYKGAKAPSQKLRLLNTGSGSLRVDDISISQAAGSGFSLGGDAPTAFPVVIEMNGLVELSVDFRPTSEGKKSGEIKVQTNEYGNDLVAIPIKGEGQACPEGFWDNDSNSDNGCEYGPCKMTDAVGKECTAGTAGCGVEICDDKDNDCNGTADDGDIAALCPNDEKVSHASYMCSTGKCIIKECDAGFWDRDKKPETGCEASCQLTNKAGEVCTKGEPGCGVEHCDGLDNDCNGTADDGVLTDMCPVDDQTMPHVSKGGGMVTCEPDVADTKTRCIHICESGWDNCDGKADILLHGCPTPVINDVNNCGGCGKVCNLPHATATCAGDKCAVSACEVDYWDLDKTDPAGGCEYGPCQLTDASGAPCKQGDVGCGAEVCDGKDNNCDGTPDNAPIATLCSAVANTTFACDLATCKITACGAGWHDLDKDSKTGCECQAVSASGGDTCGGAKDLGPLADSGGSLAFKGNLIPAGKVEWFRFTGSDNVTEDNSVGNDKYHVTVKFIANPGNQYELDVYIDDCGQPNPFQKCDSFDWYTDFVSSDANGPVGESPCTTLNNPTVPHCQDDTHTYMIKVSRVAAATATCEQFELEISNGKYHTP